jgi:NhaA family Na+:H+ antiporter
MQLLRSDRFAAILLVAAAALGLILANSPLGEAARSVETFHLGVGPLDFTVGHWIKDGLLAVFFFIAAIELRHELRHGELDTAGKALVPTAAAVGGVVAPAVIFLILVRDGDLAQGWPIPTATDIAFALGVLAIVGRSLPARFRALLLAIAVIDDLIAIIIIAAFFTRDLQPMPLLAAIPLVLLFGWLTYRVRRHSAPWLIPLLIVLGLTTWVLVALSGIHPTIAGVALGLVMSDATGKRARRAIEPWSNAVILPLFALVAALVPLPQASLSELSPAFWGVLIAMPVGKILGITAGTLVAVGLAGRRSKQPHMPLPDTIALAALGGIGFTVSLLMNELAYEPQPEVADEVTLAVLLASVIAALVGGVLTALRSRHYDRLSQSQPSTQ